MSLKRGNNKVNFNKDQIFYFLNTVDVSILTVDFSIMRVLVILMQINSS